MLVPTINQRIYLVDKASERGCIAYYGPRGLGRTQWEKAMKALVQAGFVLPNAHGDYDLTGKGEAYREGAIAADNVWLDQGEAASALRFDEAILLLVGSFIGPNVHHPVETEAGARERWRDLRAARVAPRRRPLPRHSASGGVAGARSAHDR